MTYIFSQEISKVADKRKSMLDEMAIQMQTIREQHKEELAGLKTSHKVLALVGVHFAFLPFFFIFAYFRLVNCNLINLLPFIV